MNPQSQKQNKGIILHNYVIHHFDKIYVFTIPSYYRIIGIVGKGAYGIVVSALNLKTNDKVAIKKIINLFEQNNCYQKRILREVKIMKHLSKHSPHDNILNLLDLIPPPTLQLFRDIYIVTRLMEFDLSRITNAPRQATERMVKYLLYQILDSVNFLHSVGIVHRDLKPSNILINRDLDVKVCDFGLSRGLTDGCEMMSCTYVTTRCELCLAWIESSYSCDIWSIGCIFAELLSKSENGKPKVLFPGFNYLDQLKRIFSILGKPKLNEIRGCKEAKTWVLEKIPNNIKTTDLTKIFQNCSKESVDLLKKMLQFDPFKRITVKKAMEDPFFSDIRKLNENDKDLEMEDKKPSTFSFRFDEKDIHIKSKLFYFFIFLEELYKDIIEWNYENGLKGKIHYEMTPKHIYL